jgi:hypothetical protein
MLHHTSTRDLECEGKWGPDIRHFHVADEPNDIPSLSTCRNLSYWRSLLILCKKTNRYIDFARLFSNHGFSSQDYRLVFQQRQMAPDAEKSTDDHYFCAALESDPMDPKTHGLYFTNRRSFLFAPKPHLPPSARKM